MCTKSLRIFRLHIFIYLSLSMASDIGRRHEFIDFNILCVADVFFFWSNENEIESSWIVQCLRANIKNSVIWYSKRMNAANV